MSKVSRNSCVTPHDSQSAFARGFSATVASSPVADEVMMYFNLLF